MFPNGAGFEKAPEITWIVGYYDEYKVSYIFDSMDASYTEEDGTFVDAGMNWIETYKRKDAQRFTDLTEALQLMAWMLVQGCTKVFIEDITPEMEKYETSN